jgi:Fe-S-cluster containining protein
VFLSQNDLEALCQEWDLDSKTFIERYCKRVSMGPYNPISLKLTQDNDCIFWTTAGCSVYRARPIQCRSYPFWASRQRCPGIGKGPAHSQEEVADWITQRRNEGFIEE